MGLGDSILKALLADSANFAESGTYTPAANPEAVPVSCTVRFVRHEPSLDRRAEKSVLVRSGIMEVLSSVDATYGGIVLPTIGDQWNLGILKGGSAVAWSAGAPRGGDGRWFIPLTREEIQEVGGHREGKAN